VAAGNAALQGILGSVMGSFGIPGFAAGGDHLGGMRIVGENGPELEVTGPSRIYNAEQTRKMLVSQAPSGGNSFSFPTTVNVDASADKAQTLSAMQRILNENNKRQRDQYERAGLLGAT